MHLTKEKIVEFNIPIEANKVDKVVEISINSIKELNGIISIDSTYSIDSSKENIPIKIRFEKDDLLAPEAFFVGWSFIDFFSESRMDGINYTREDFRNDIRIAREYLVLSIEKGYKSSLPSYLLALPPLRYTEFPNTIKAMHYAISNYPDAPPGFYSLIYEKDSNRMRGLGALTKGLKRFPRDFKLNNLFSDYLIEREEYKEAVKYLDNIDINIYRASVAGDKYDTTLNYYYYKLLNCYIKLKKFDDAKKLLDDVGSIESYEEALLKGIYYHSKREFKEAIKFFESCSTDDILMHSVYACNFYLIDCYLETGDLKAAREILLLLPEYIYTYKERIFNSSYMDIADNALRKLVSLNIDELVTAKAKSLLAQIVLYERLIPGRKIEKMIMEDDDYLNDIWSAYSDVIGRELTKREMELLAEAELLLKESIPYYPKNKLLGAFYSDVLYLMKDPDGAQIQKVKSLKPDHEDYPILTRLRDCSEGFIEGYPKKLEEIFKEDEKNRGKYIKSLLSKDIQELFTLGKHELIAGLYDCLKFDLDLQDTLPLYEIAHSLKVIGRGKEAAGIYRKEIANNRENIRAYNELAAIYENRGDFDEALELLKSAMSFKKDDALTNLNYKRINGKKESDTANLKKAEKLELGITFDPEESQIKYGENSCNIPPNSAEYFVTRAVFDRPGEKVMEENIFGDLDDAKMMENPRTINDARRRVNKKVEESLGIKGLIEYRGSYYWLKKTLIK